MLIPLDEMDYRKLGIVLKHHILMHCIIICKVELRIILRV